MISLDTLYDCYASGKQTKQQTINALLKAMYDHPKYFQLDKFSLENRQDFMVFCHPHLEQIVNAYEPGRSSFATFFNYCMAMERRRYFKKYYRSYAREKAISQYLEDSVPPSAAEPENPLSFITEEEIDPRQLVHRIPGFNRIKSLTPEQKLLILTLKSAYFVTAPMISRIAPAIGMTESQLEQLVRTMNLSLATRIQRVSHHYEKINQAWIFKKQLQYQLEEADKASCLYEELKESIRIQDRILNRYNSAYRKVPPMSPSNKLIASTINVSPSAISHFLKVLNDKNGNSGILTS